MKKVGSGVRSFFSGVGDFFRWWNESKIITYCAETSFFLFTALIPMLMLAFTLSSMTPLKPQNVVDFILSVIPAAGRSFIEEIVESVFASSSSGTLTFSLVFVLWSAATAFMAIRKALNVIYNLQETRGYLFVRGICTLYTIIFLLGLTGILLMSFYSHQILQAANQVFFDGSAADWLVRAVNFLISEGILLLVFQFLYAFLPAKPQRFRRQLPGALFSSLTMNLVMTIFSWLTGQEGAYSFYGSLRSVIILVLSIYILVFIVFLGAGINYRRAQKHARASAPPPPPQPYKQTMRPFEP